MMKKLLVAIAALCACSRSNPNYCANAPDHNCHEQIDAPRAIDAPPACSSTNPCTGSAAPVCDLGMGQCVACTATNIGACAANTPVCATNETCRACASHDECSNGGAPGACLPTGACGDDTMVAWMIANGTGDCTRASPCGSLMTALGKNKPYIRFLANGTLAQSESVVIAQDVTILADAGAKLTASSGAAITVNGTHNVTIQDLHELGAQVGVLVNSINTPTLTLDHVLVEGNSGVGVSISGGTLAMSRSIVSHNTGGGLLLTQASFSITNSIFVYNGGTTASFGGLNVGPNNTTSVFAFNTVELNATTSANNMTCSNTLAATGVIIGDATTGCTFAYSLFPPGSANATGTNKAGNAAFVSNDFNNPGDPGYFRIASTSDAKNSADPNSTVKVDIDLRARPRSGGGYDIGASQAQ